MSINGVENQDVAMMLGEAGEAFFVRKQENEEPTLGVVKVTRALEATSE